MALRRLSSSNTGANSRVAQPLVAVARHACRCRRPCSVSKRVGDFLQALVDVRQRQHGEHAEAAGMIALQLLGVLVGTRARRGRRLGLVEEVHLRRRRRRDRRSRRRPCPCRRAISAPTSWPSVGCRDWPSSPPRARWAARCDGARRCDAAWPARRPWARKEMPRMRRASAPRPTRHEIAAAGVDGRLRRGRRAASAGAKKFASSRMDHSVLPEIYRGD